jgi:hypothetical protein
MLPPSERGQDPAREALEHGLAAEPSHPLTGDEAEAAEHDPGRAERVYAPAAERVPKPPTPGDRALVEGGMAARREEAHAGAAAASAEPSAASPSGPDGAPDSAERSRRPSTAVMVGVGAGALAVAGAAGTAWVCRRWRRERDRPTNRLRRQARRAAAEPTWRVGGLGAALALAALLGRALRARAGRDGPLDGAAARPRDVTGTRRGPAAEEVRAGRGKLRFPAIDPRSATRVRPVAEFHQGGWVRPGRRVAARLDRRQHAPAP